MQSWKGILKRMGVYDGIYNWDNVSEAFYRIIRKFIKKTDKIIELGSSTGHISYRLAKEGYNVTLLDIRKEAIKTAKQNFKKKNIKAYFICGDIFDITDKYDIAWSSGLIQCFDDPDKAKLIKKIAGITNRLILFYPDVENPNKIKGLNKKMIPGVGDAKEYDIKKIPEIIYEYFDELYYGIAGLNEVGLDYSMYWIYARKE
jgi:SAM-dependent methyltransferase